MKQVFLFVMSLSLAPLAGADDLPEPFEVSVKLYKGDKVWSNPRIVTLANEEAVIESGSADGLSSYGFGVTPKRRGAGEVKLSMRFFEKINGERREFRVNPTVEIDGLTAAVVSWADEGGEKFHYNDLVAYVQVKSVPKPTLTQ